MRKLGGYFGLILSICLFFHCLTQILSYDIDFNPFFFVVVGIIIVSLFVAHVAITIIICIITKDFTSVVYKKANFKTLYQRISGVLIVVFAIIHIVFSLQYDISLDLMPLMGITSIIFFILCYSHIAISFPRGLVLIGAVSSVKKIKIIQVIVYIACAILLFYSIKDIIDLFIILEII